MYIKVIKIMFDPIGPEPEEISELLAYVYMWAYINIHINKREGVVLFSTYRDVRDVRRALKKIFKAYVPEVSIEKRGENAIDN